MRPAATADVPNDVQRDRILRFLYDRHRSARGLAKIPIGIRDLQGGLKQLHGMSQQEVSSHLDFLVQVGWAREVAKARSFTTAKGMEISREQTKYKISDVGITHLESATVFKKADAASHVNITNIKGVTVVGSGNVVNTEFADLSRALDDLDKAVGSSSALSDEQKLDAAGDLSAIRAQLAKQAPTVGVVAAAWRSLQVVGTMSDVSDAFVKVKALITHFVG